MTILIPSSTVVPTSTSVVPPLFTVFADKDGAAMELGVLEFTDGTGSFSWLLVDNDTAAFGATIISFENISLEVVSTWDKKIFVRLKCFHSMAQDAFRFNPEHLPCQHFQQHACDPSSPAS